MKSRAQALVTRRARASEACNAMKWGRRGHRATPPTSILGFSPLRSLGALILDDSGHSPRFPMGLASSQSLTALDLCMENGWTCAAAHLPRAPLPRSPPLARPRPLPAGDDAGAAAGVLPGAGEP